MDDIVEKRKAKILSWLKTNNSYISYIILGIIVFLAVRIRTLNMHGLKDITTGGWTLGPDLDPFLFLRWAKYIVENGSLVAVDYMRYFPIGFETRGELLLLPYMIAWFHNIVSFFGSPSVEFSAIIFPVFMFGITIIAFFFMTRALFVKHFGIKNSNIIALVGSFFLSVLPSLLPRTIAGIPEKESAAFFFMFMSFYFFIKAWNSESNRRYIFGALAGIFTAGMALIWGGFAYIFFTIGLAVLIAYVLEKTDLKKASLIGVWFVTALILMTIFSSRYALTALPFHLTNAPFILFFAATAFDQLRKRTKIDSALRLNKIKIPYKLMSLSLVIIAGIIFLLIFKFSYITNTLSGIIQTLTTPIVDRLGVTVAENRQPFFAEWTRDFGPTIGGISLTFWFGVIGSVLLLNYGVRHLGKKSRRTLLGGYVILLIAIIYSRYSGSSILNGDSFASLVFYFGGIILFLVSVVYVYFMHYKENKEHLLKEIDFNILFVLSMFLFGIIAAKSSVRTTMVFVPTIALMVGFALFISYNSFLKTLKNKKYNIHTIIFVILAIITLFAGYTLYSSVSGAAGQYYPGIYNHQWQQAMSWVRENTNENAVFGHWWDYGYWVQSLGERATILDGGNAIGYWNYFLARHVLTANSAEDSVDFLYTHNATHLLIDSTDIGKYAAFSSIGSDPSYDRKSWINTFLLDRNSVQQTKNRTILVYGGGSVLDQDIIYESQGETIFLPGLNDQDGSSGNYAGIAAVKIEVEQDGSIKQQPVGVFVYQGQQYQLPLRYVFTENSSIDFGTGLETGVFLFPRIDQVGQGVELVPNGALLYLSQRTVRANLARLYLYSEQSDIFELAHSQDDLLITNLKQQGLPIGEFVYYQGFRGPIKIWEINYPSSAQYKEEFVDTSYPDFLRRA